MGRVRRLADLAGVLARASSGQILSFDDSGAIQSTASSSGTTVYADMTALIAATGMSSGDQALVTATNNIYIYNGSGWYKIATVQNDSPSAITGVNGSYALAIDGTPTVITAVSTDPEGFPLTWTYSTSGLGSIATVSQADNVFTITPSTTEADAGTFSLTINATDGVNGAVSASTNLTLDFIVIVENSKYTAVLATAVSTGDNSTVTDSSTNNHTVTLPSNGHVNSNSFSPYRHGGYSTYFDGSGDYLSFGYDNVTLDGEFVIELWANFTEMGSSAPNKRLFTSRDLGNNAANFQFVIEYGGSGGSVGVYTNTWVLGNGVGTDLSTRINDGLWHHICVTRDSSNVLKIFYDGVEEDSATNITTSFVLDNPYIGTRDSGTNSSNYKGYISDLRIRTGVSSFSVPTERLTSDANTVLLACHKPYFIEEGGRSITVNGNTLTKPFTPYDNSEYSAANHGGSIYLDGTDDRLSIANIGLSGDLTLEGWFYQSVAQSATFRCIISASTYGTSAPGRIYTNGSDVRAYVNTTTYISGSFVANTWNHVALVRTSGTWTLYINGQSTGTNTTSGSYDFDSTVDWTVGGDVNGAYPFTGNVSDIRFTNSAVYSSNFTPPSAPLSSTGASLLIKGTDASVIDKSQANSNIRLAGTSGTSTSQIKFASTVSIYSDGNSGNGSIVRVPISEPTGTQDFTLELWYYGLIGSAGAYSTVLSGGSSTGAFKGVIIGHDQWWLGANSGNTTIPNSSGKISNNTWQHLAVTRSSGTVYAYKDGVYFGTATSSMNLDTTEYSLFTRYVGSSSWLTSGYIQDFRITNGLARYSGTSNFTPPAAPLKG